MDLHPHQFKLFYGAQDLKDEITFSYDISPKSAYATHYGLERSSSSDEDYDDWDYEEEDLDEMWGRKLTESKQPADSGVHGAGVHESLAKHGWRGPGKVQMEWEASEWKGEEPSVRLQDAHHRVAAAADIERTTGRDVWIPVEHHDYELPYRLAQQHRQAFPKTYHV